MTIEWHHINTNRTRNGYVRHSSHVTEI